MLILNRVSASSKSVDTELGGWVEHPDRSALRCADLVEGLGDMAYPYIDDLLDDMSGSGLSEDLTHCLRAISVCVPSKQMSVFVGFAFAMHLSPGRH